VHAVENTFIVFLPHIPPAVKKHTCRLPTVSDACTGDVLLKPFSRLLARQTRGYIPLQPEPQPNSTIYLLGKDAVDEEIFCILRLQIA
jgi:hypothetical protein